MNRSTSKAIWWIRRDMRLTDNPALLLAKKKGLVVHPVFVLDPKILNNYPEDNPRLDFMLNSLRSLSNSIESCGGQLSVHYGNPIELLPRILASSGADEVLAQYDPGSYSRSRDAEVAKILPLTMTPGLSITNPDEVLAGNGNSYKIFSPYYRAWMPKALIEITKADESLNIGRFTNSGESSLLGSFPTRLNKNFPASEIEANRRLSLFFSNAESGSMLSNYNSYKDRLDMTATSQMSPYLRFGLISPRLMAKKAIEILRTDASTFTGATSWISELAWRDFYISKTHHFLSSKKIERSDSSEYFPWRDDTEQYEKWCAGQTGIPIIDAIMRQLCSEGWISNRARMVTASFLTKQLLIDWRWGSDWFMKKLIDGDPFANSGGWQWVAGVGVGSAPYFRIFNPVLQAKKYDPHGVYVRRWVPELGSIQSQNIHEPWLLNEQNRKNSDSENYPSPIVDLNAARDRALSVYKTTRGNNR